VTWKEGPTVPSVLPEQLPNTFSPSLPLLLLLFCRRRLLAGDFSPRPHPDSKGVGAWLDFNIELGAHPVPQLTFARPPPSTPVL
jgi:hypothetical protein